MKPDPIKLILVDRNISLCEQWEKHFDGLPNVEVKHKSFEDIREYDCMVSPANSFGLMDGGIDYAIIRFFGQSLMDRVQKRILDEFLGEQPVGTSIIVETGHAKHPFLAHTPTMRVPMDIDHTDHAYTAMWAMLIAVHRHNRIAERKITSVLCPGLGTGTGHIPYAQAAFHMAQADKHYLNPPQALTWNVADERHKYVEYFGKNMR